MYKEKEKRKKRKRAKIHFYGVCQKRNTDVRNWSGHINHMNFTILPQPGRCLHKTAPDSNKSWTAPWKPWEEEMRMMRRGKRKSEITGGSERGERKTNGEIKKCSFILISYFSKRVKQRVV